MAKKIEIGRRAFTKWRPWHNERQELACYNQVGIYALLHLKNGQLPPRGRADVNDEQVVYIGLAHKKQSFRSRWYAFQSAAFGSGNSHAGGKTYRELIGDKGKNLYVAAMAVEYDEPKIRDVFIKYIERKLIWEHVRRNRRLPRCNKE